MKKIKNKRYKILVLIILIIGIMVRIIGIINFPGGLNQDEASSGYEAWSLLKQGIDRHGKTMPVHFISWGSGQNVLYSYLMIPFIYLANTYKNTNKKANCKEFNYINKNINPTLIILLAVFVVIVRGYVGYGIPTSWNKTIPQLILFYVIMGIGKALGGILSDAIGIRKVAVISTIVSIPFLCFGDNIMIVSIIGIMMFSMTMAITLAVLVSVLKKAPGLAFGLTTIGLFLGTAPIFFIKITSFALNIGLIITMSILCCTILLAILKKEGKKNELGL